MSYIYVSGDSYCAWRNNPEKDWPLILANQLNLTLEGGGYPGQGWWPTRQHLLEYIESDKFYNTKYFVFCHTDPVRMLRPTNLSKPSELAEKIWFAEIHSREVCNWCASQWYQELNQLLPSRQVIHLRCFDSDLKVFVQLNGLKFTTVLVNIALESTNGDYKRINQGPNHFTPDYNIKFANFLAGHMINYSEKTLEISF